MTRDNDLTWAIEYMPHVGAWMKLEEHVRELNRFVPHDPGYFKQLLDDCLAHRSVLPKDTFVYRARIMPFPRHDSTEPLMRGEMSAPPAALAPAGRLNPMGIPYLYTASDERTAVAELRPWRDARLTVARLRLVTGQNLVDLRDIDAIPARSAAYWTAFMFGRPAHQEDRLAYSVTQLISEHLKAAGADGVLYQSAMRPDGFNAAFFNPLAATVESRQLIEVSATEIRHVSLGDWTT